MMMPSLLRRAQIPRLNPESPATSSEQLLTIYATRQYEPAIGHGVFYPINFLTLIEKVYLQSTS